MHIYMYSPYGLDYLMQLLSTIFLKLVYYLDPIYLYTTFRTALTLSNFTLSLLVLIDLLQEIAGIRLNIDNQSIKNYIVIII